MASTCCATWTRYVGVAGLAIDTGGEAAAAGPDVPFLCVASDKAMGLNLLQLSRSTACRVTSLLCWLRLCITSLCFAGDR
jgi:hypothetical protein